MSKACKDRLLAGAVLALSLVAAWPAGADPQMETARVPASGVVHRDETVPLPRPAPTSRGTMAETQPANGPATHVSPASQTNDTDIKNASGGLPAQADTPVSAQLRALIEAKYFGRRDLRPSERRAIREFYRARHDAPLWIAGGRFTAHARAVIARLQDAAADGLDPADYPVPQVAAADGPKVLAKDDLTLTQSALIFARQLSTGRIAPTRVDAQVDYHDHAPQPLAVLRKISEAADVNAAFDSFNPPQKGFQALKRKLAALRADPGTDQDRIPPGSAIRPGRRDRRVPLLRQALGLEGRSNDTYYDRTLYEAVVRFQRDNGIKPTGIVDARTLAALNGPTQQQVIDIVRANMERWRWLPRDLGSTYVMVNILDFSLKVVHDGRAVWRTDIVVGKPTTPTPLLGAVMDNIIVNPSWTVPQSIIQKELLPAYQHDSNIFARLGLEVKQSADGNMEVVQPPGARNALGRIKFNFPNKYAVYLHDTPEKNLFKYDRRAFSHGCMRVEDPTLLAQVLLHYALKDRAPDAREIQSMFGQQQYTFRLAHKPMVYLTYQTAFVGDGGRLELRNDIYGLDARIHDILHGNERRVADRTPPAAKSNINAYRIDQAFLRRVEQHRAEPPRIEPPRVERRQVEQSRVDNPLQFFSRLFH